MDKGYNYKISDGYLNYEFYSEGPKGRIKKGVRFTPYNTGGLTYYNLTLGDWNEERKQLDDKAISNNQDREKILITVASLVLEFTTHFPDTYVYAQGSTPARTRLYQMGISSHREQIETLFYVYGYIDEKWQAFKPSINYDAFMVLKK